MAKVRNEPYLNTKKILLLDSQQNMGHPLSDTVIAKVFPLHLFAKVNIDLRNYGGGGAWGDLQTLKKRSLIVPLNIH